MILLADYALYDCNTCNYTSWLHLVHFQQLKTCSFIKWHPRITIIFVLNISVHLIFCKPEKIWKTDIWIMPNFGYTHNFFSNFLQVTRIFYTFVFTGVLGLHLFSDYTLYFLVFSQLLNCNFLISPRIFILCLLVIPCTLIFVKIHSL